MWKQVEEIGTDVMSIGAAFPEGINLLGYSQGGLLARAILQRFPEHNVQNFISLSSPQAGQYGSTISNQIMINKKIQQKMFINFLIIINFQLNFCI